MKRSLFIAIVVLLMAALFVSCSADKAMEDQLVEVRVAADGSRALSATGTMDVNVEGLYWYYSATKVSGPFNTGATEWAAVKTGEKVFREEISVRMMVMETRKCQRVAGASVSMVMRHSRLQNQQNRRKQLFTIRQD